MHLGHYRRLAAALATSLLLAGGVAHADGIPGAPPPFDKGGVKLALVAYLSGGDYFQAAEAGATRQAKALGVDLRIFPGRQKPDEQREQLREAIDLGFQGIIISGGKAEAIDDLVKEAIGKGIKIVAGNIYLNEPEVVIVDHDESRQLNLVLDQVLKENGDGFKAGYIYVEGFPALDRRDKAWTAFKAKHPGVQQLAQWGAVDDSTAETVANQTAAALRANPDITVIIAPYDEFARGAKLAVNEAGLADKVRIYSVDVSTSDIHEIREKGSPWVATSATSAEGNGAVQVRALALALTGELKDNRIIQTPALITRQFLDDNDIKNEEELVRKLPAFLARDVAAASWIPTQ
jgi:simple sugar transport system substrate-binding protein